MTESTESASLDGFTRRCIVVGVDGSPWSDAALRWACGEAALRGVDVEAVLAWAYLDQPHPPGEERFDPHYTPESAARALDVFVRQATGSDAPAVARKVVCDLPARALVEASTSAEMLVVGARGQGGFRELLVGSVSRRCAHVTTVPLVVVRRGSELAQYGRIVVGVDGSDNSAVALRWARREAALRGSGLAVLHAWPSPSSALGFPGSAWDRDAHQLIDRMLAQAGVDEPLDGPGPPIDRIVVAEGAAGSLREASSTADLVVVGRRGHGGLPGLLLGSVADQVAAHAVCPTAVIP